MDNFGFYISSIVFKSYRDHKSLLLFMFSSEKKCKMQIQHFCFVDEYIDCYNNRHTRVFQNFQTLKRIAIITIIRTTSKADSQIANSEDPDQTAPLGAV